jgi:hypothetical protein
LSVNSARRHSGAKMRSKTNPERLRLSPTPWLEIQIGRAGVQVLAAPPVT